MSAILPKSSFLDGGSLTSSLLTLSTKESMACLVRSCLHLTKPASRSSLHFFSLATSAFLSRRWNSAYTLLFSRMLKFVCSALDSKNRCRAPSLK